MVCTQKTTDKRHGFTRSSYPACDMPSDEDYKTQLSVKCSAKVGQRFEICKLITPLPPLRATTINIYPSVSN